VQYHQLPDPDTSNPIDAPTACKPYPVGDGITVVPSYLPVPGMGVLPAHAFVLDGPEPMLVDTGPGGGEDGFRTALASIVDPADLRWLWLTHTDPDHTGSLAWLLEAAPELRVITTFLAVGKLGMQMEVPMHRLAWVNPGTTVEINGRRLAAIRPPSYDAPETTGFHDLASGTLFPADSFGGLLRRPAAFVDDVPSDELSDGMSLWSTIDAPWLTHTDRDHLHAQLSDLRGRGIRRVLSSHLPPADGRTDELLEILAVVPGTRAWVGPDQAALDQLLAAVGG
jgi:hypothetical protein